MSFVISPGRPDHVPAAEEVQVQVEDGLAAVAALVEDEPIPIFGQAFVGGNLLGGGKEGGQSGRVLGSEVGHAAQMLVGNDEDVGGGLRVDVAKGGDQVILVDNFSWKLTAYDFAENAI